MSSPESVKACSPMEEVRVCDWKDLTSEKYRLRKCAKHASLDDLKGAEQGHAIAPSWITQSLQQKCVSGIKSIK